VAALDDVFDCYARNGFQDQEHDSQRDWRSEFKICPAGSLNAKPASELALIVASDMGADDNESSPDRFALAFVAMFSTYVKKNESANRILESSESLKS
jgi:hypothetical protein